MNAGKRMVVPVIARMLKQHGDIPGLIEKRLRKMPADDQKYTKEMLELFGMGSSLLIFAGTETSLKK